VIADPDGSEVRILPFGFGGESFRVRQMERCDLRIVAAGRRSAGVGDLDEQARAGDVAGFRFFDERDGDFAGLVGDERVDGVDQAFSSAAGPGLAGAYRRGLLAVGLAAFAAADFWSAFGGLWFFGAGSVVDSGHAGPPK
jgi:hypothetical protein